MPNITTSLILFVLLLVSGCGSGVDVIKNAPAPGLENKTIGEVLDNHLDNPQWTEKTEENGEITIEFTGLMTQRLHEVSVQSTVLSYMSDSLFRQMSNGAIGYVDAALNDQDLFDDIWKRGTQHFYERFKHNAPGFKSKGLADLSLFVFREDWVPGKKVILQWKVAADKKTFTELKTTAEGDNLVQASVEGICQRSNGPTSNAKRLKEYIPEGRSKEFASKEIACFIYEWSGGSKGLTKRAYELAEQIPDYGETSTNDTSLNIPQMASNLDAQVTAFLRPPAPERKVNDWTIMGKAQAMSGETYIRVSTDDCMETSSRMGCNMLLLDYSPQGEPRISIAIEPMSSVEEVMPDYIDKLQYGVFVGGVLVGKITFNIRPSAQAGFIVLEQESCVDPEAIYENMKSASMVTFLNLNQQRFDFDVRGLEEVENIVR